MEENNINEQPTYRMYTSSEKNKKQPGFFKNAFVKAVLPTPISPYRQRKTPESLTNEANALANFEVSSKFLILNFIYAVILSIYLSSALCPSYISEIC